MKRLSDERKQELAAMAASPAAREYRFGWTAYQKGYGSEMAATSDEYAGYEAARLHYAALDRVSRVWNDAQTARQARARTSNNWTMLLDDTAQPAAIDARADAEPVAA